MLIDNTKNDDRILKLKEEIRIKKEKIEKVKRFVPQTNCIITIDDKTYNINVLNKQNLLLLAAKLGSMKMGLKLYFDIELIELSGFDLQLWIDDIKNKIEILSIKDEKAKLKVMEDKLTSLLSEGKKVELEIDELEKMIKGEL